MIKLDYGSAIAVTREIYWVGFYDEHASLHCNPYLLVDEKDVVLFDPGSIPHFPIVMRKIVETINPSEISVIEGNQVQTAIEHLKSIPCGMDLLQ